LVVGAALIEKLLFARNMYCCCWLWCIDILSGLSGKAGVMPISTACVAAVSEPRQLDLTEGNQVMCDGKHNNFLALVVTINLRSEIYT
jgi:hypothetical protein